MNYLLIVLFSAAITAVFVRGSIFEPLRTHGSNLWKGFAACALCVGVWVGAGATLLASSRGLLPAGFPVLFAALGLGSLAGAAALLYVRLVDWLESATVERETAEAVNKLRAKVLLAELEQCEPQVAVEKARNGECRGPGYLDQWIGTALQDVDLATLKKAVEEKEKRRA